MLMDLKVQSVVKRKVSQIKSSIPVTKRCTRGNVIIATQSSAFSKFKEIVRVVLG